MSAPKAYVAAIELIARLREKLDAAEKEIEALEEKVDFGVSVMGELRTLVEELRAENLKLRQDLRKENNEFQDLKVQYEQREDEVIELRKQLKSVEGQADELTIARRQAREIAEQVEGENEELLERLRLRFCLVEDTDCHWYVIPAERVSEWNRFAAFSDEDSDAPDWARRVPGSPSLVTFNDYGIR